MEWTQGERELSEVEPRFLLCGAIWMAVPLGEGRNLGKR